MKRRRTPPATARPDRLNLAQASALVADLPHCTVIRGGRALQLVNAPDSRQCAATSFPAERPFRPVMAMLDAFLVSLDRDLSHTTIVLAGGRVSVVLATPGVGLTLADVETARLIVQRWAITK